MDNPRAWFEAALMDAKIKDFRWHDLRHTFCSRLAMAGVDIRTIAQLAGHKTLAMAMRYSHLSPFSQSKRHRTTCGWFPSGRGWSKQKGTHHRANLMTIIPESHPALGTWLILAKLLNECVGLLSPIQNASADWSEKPTCGY